MSNFSMDLPKNFVEALNRRHNGRKLEPIVIRDLTDRMNYWYNKYKKAEKSLNKLLEFWDKKQVESHFMEPIWYNAHSRRKKHVNNKLEAHKRMFYILLQADGNNETFDINYCISVEEIYEDFNSKYKEEI